MSQNTSLRDVLVGGAVATCLLGLTGLLDSRGVTLGPRTSDAAAAAVPYTAYQEAAILAAMAQGADFGPGLVEVPPGGSNAAVRGTPNDLNVGELFLTIQNLGSCSLQVVLHAAASGSSQLGIIGPYSSGSIAFRLAARDTLQVLSLTDGAEARYAWSARTRDPL